MTHDSTAVMMNFGCKNKNKNREFIVLMSYPYERTGSQPIETGYQVTGMVSKGAVI
jgi:hypothetical protein